MRSCAHFFNNDWVGINISVSCCTPQYTHASYDIMNIRDAMSVTTQSTPLSKPSPVTAEHPKIVQWRPDMSSPSKSSTYNLEQSNRINKTVCEFYHRSSLSAPLGTYTPFPHCSPPHI